jgi:adenylate kinase family enzyme
MRKILVIGAGGAGKSTLARRLAACGGLPLIHLDALYWHPGWVPTPNDLWDQEIARLIAQDAWVMDGNYGRTLPPRLAACDTVIFLDRPRWRCLWHLLRRRLEYRRKGRPDLAAGCPERITWEFISWVWTYPKRRRPALLRQLAALEASKRVVMVRNDRDIERLMAEMAAALGAT